MKNIFLLIAFAAFVLVSCDVMQTVEPTKDVQDVATNQPGDTTDKAPPAPDAGPTDPLAGDNPAPDGWGDFVKSWKYIRQPNALVTKALVSRVIASQDPLYDQCNEPGTVYLFRDDGAIIQYTPADTAGSFTLLVQAIQGDVMVHNVLVAKDVSEYWDYKIVYPIVPPLPEHPPYPTAPNNTVLLVDRDTAEILYQSDYTTDRAYFDAMINAYKSQAMADEQFYGKYEVVIIGQWVVP